MESPWFNVGGSEKDTLFLIQLILGHNYFNAPLKIRQTDLFKSILDSYLLNKFFEAATFLTGTKIDNISEYVLKIENCLEAQSPLEELNLEVICGHNGIYYTDY